MRIPAERDIPRRHRIAVTWVGFTPARLLLRHSEYCGLCDRLALPSAEEARGYIALLMRSRGYVAREDDYTFHPYPCPHLAGMWHVGQDHTLIERLSPGKHGPAVGDL